jgi:hypothetical protein
VGSTTARVIGPSGAETDSRAVWIRGAADSLLLTLRHSGFVGSLSLGAPGEVRAGIMRSHPTAAALERRSEAAPQPQSEPARQPRNAGARRTTDAIEAAPAVPVVARRSACPTR